MKRHDFLTSNLTAAGLLGAAAMIPSAAKAARPDTIVKRWEKAKGKFPGGKRPNVLWVQTDEQRPDSLGCYGSDWARTPNIDSVAARGTLFTECHVQSPGP